MKFKNVFIEAFAYEDPDVFLSSDELEAKLAPMYNRLKLPEGRLELSTGIKSRGYFSRLNPSGISANAGEKALRASAVKREDIDLLIHSSVCRDFLEPSTASVVHNLLGLAPRCGSFDLSNACLGFLDAMNLAAIQIEAGAIKNALIVTGENSRPLIEQTVPFLNQSSELTRKSVKKYFANLTIGSAGVAFVLTGSPVNPLAKLEGSIHLSDTSSARLCQGDGSVNGLMMETESEELLHAGIALAKEGHRLFKDEVYPEVDHVIGHQVGVAHRNLLMETLELDKQKDFITYDRYGNTGSAACPLTLIRAYEAGALKKDGRVAMLGIGSGLHTNMVGALWL